MKRLLELALLLLCTRLAAAADTEVVRPMIWVTEADRAPILAKIEKQPWARSAFEAMQARVRDAVARHREDPAAFLREFLTLPNPADPKGNPTFAPIIRKFTGEQPAQSVVLQYRASLAVDCGVLYFLTGDEAYASCAADILNVLVEGLVQLKPDPEESRGGILFPKDLLYEVRVLGAQIPLIYDFIHPYLKTGAKVHHPGHEGQFPFNFEHAQSLFRSYARVIIDRGLINNNHPVLEMPALAHNVLALDDASERAQLLEYLVSKDTPHQDSLAKVIGVYARSGAVWPESLQYSAAVSSFVTYMVTLVRRQDPALISNDHCPRTGTPG